MILALRIPMRLVQRLVRTCPGAGNITSILCVNRNWRVFGRSRQTCIWSIFLISAVGLCAQLAITDLPLKLTPGFWSVVTHYFTQCNMSSVTVICLSYFDPALSPSVLTPLPGISTKFRLKSHFTAVLPRSNTVTSLPLHLWLPKSRGLLWGKESRWSWGDELWGLYMFLLLKANRFVVFFIFQRSGWAVSLPARCFPSDSVRTGHARLAGEYALWLCSGKPVSTYSAYIGWTLSDLCWDYCC